MRLCSYPRILAADRFRLRGNPLQVMAHDWSGELPASNGLESEALERGSRTRKHIGCTARPPSVDRIRFECRCVGTLGGFQCFSDQSRHDAPSAIAAPDIEAGEGTNRHIIDLFESSLAIEPGQILAASVDTNLQAARRQKLTSLVWWTLLHDSMERALFLSRGRL